MKLMQLKIPLGNRRKIPYVLLGMFSTMPVVGIHISGRDISFYRILYVVFLFAMILDVLKNKRIQVGKHSSKMLAWLLLGMFSCVIGFVFLRDDAEEWGKAAGSSIVKIIPLLFFLVLWSSDGIKNRHNQEVIKGFIIGCTLNCIWAVIDAAGFYLFGRSINNIVFAGYVARNKIHYGMMSLTMSGTIRATGFNYDPAHIGFVAPVVAGYGLLRRKVSVMVLAALAAIASMSTTALVSSLLVMMVIILNKNLGIVSSAKIRRYLIGLLAFGILALLILQIGGFGFLNTATSGFLDRITNVYMADTEDIRLTYIRFIPAALFFLGPLALFGTGFGTASYAYVCNPALSSVFEKVWYFAYDMENTYIAYLMDTGIVGMVLYIMIIRTVYRRFKCRLISNRESEFNASELAIALASVFSMAFYHYILAASQMLFFTVALTELDKKDNLETGVI